MHHFSITLLLIFFFTLCFNLPTYSAIKGGINYNIPFDYSKLSEPELENKARNYYTDVILTEGSVNDENVSNALFLYTVLQNMNPKSIEYSVKLGILYDKINQSKYAKSNFVKAIGLNPQNPITYFYYGNFYYTRSMYKKALKYYEKSYMLGYCKNYELLSKLGDIYQKLGDTRKALIYLHEAKNINSNDELNKKIEDLEAKNNNNLHYYKGSILRK